MAYALLSHTNIHLSVEYRVEGQGSKPDSLALWSCPKRHQGKREIMSTQIVTGHYQRSFSPGNVEPKPDILQPDALTTGSAFNSRNRKLAVLRTSFIKKLLIYLGVVGVSLAVLPIQAEAGPHHGGFRGGYHHGHFRRGYYGYHRGYYYSGYGHRFFYPGYYPYYGYGGPGACFTFRFN